MILKPISFIQITASGNNLFGLTESGDVYTIIAPGSFVSDKEKKNTKVWKKMPMVEEVILPRPREEKEALEEPRKEEIVETYIYTQPYVVKAVQSALITAGYYYAKNNVDGTLGTFTKKAIQDFRKANNLPESDNIDIELWRKLQELGMIKDEPVV